VGLAVVAGVLIACLVGAITLSRLRRRDGRANRRAGRARHAKGQPSPSTAPIPARVVIWESTPTTPTTPWSGGGVLRRRDGMLGKRSGPQRRPEPAGNPPWPPAAPPRDPASLPAMLPAQTVATKPDPPLAPWERSPEAFAVAQRPGEPPWPISNTGPMYVWNPATATGPILAVNDDED
jgi:hypothetical protein